MKNIDFDVEFKKYLQKNNNCSDINNSIMSEIKSAYIAGWLSATEKYYNEQQKYKAPSQK